MRKAVVERNWLAKIINCRWSPAWEDIAWNMTGCQVGIALATFWILDLTSEKCGFASAAPNGLKDQHIHTWLSISVGPEHLVFEGQ
jgi:hypothetical protein